MGLFKRGLWFAFIVLFLYIFVSMLDSVGIRLFDNLIYTQVGFIIFISYIVFDWSLAFYD